MKLILKRTVNICLPSGNIIVTLSHFSFTIFKLSHMASHFFKREISVLPAASSLQTTGK